MPNFPVFIDVGAVPPLVVGDGDLAESKVRTLLLKAPRVTLSSAHVPPSLSTLVKDGLIDVLPSGLSEAEIRGRPLVVSATGDNAEDTRISALARSLGVPVNVPDRPELCTFILGAIVDRGNVTIAISTDGAAPMLATELLARLEQEIDPRLGRVAAIAREYRNAAEHHVPRGAARRVLARDRGRGSSRGDPCRR